MTTLTGSSIQLTLTDDLGDAAANRLITITGPDGVTFQQSTDLHGKIRVVGHPIGDYTAADTVTGATLTITVHVDPTLLQAMSDAVDGVGVTVDSDGLATIGDETFFTSDTATAKFQPKEATDPLLLTSDVIDPTTDKFLPALFDQDTVSVLLPLTSAPAASAAMTYPDPADSTKTLTAHDGDVGVLPGPSGGGLIFYGQASGVAAVTGRVQSPPKDVAVTATGPGAINTRETVTAGTAAVVRSAPTPLSAANLASCATPPLYIVRVAHDSGTGPVSVSYTGKTTTVTKTLRGRLGAITLVQLGADDWTALAFDVDPDVSDAAVFAQRRRELPGTTGLLTALSGTLPTVTVSAAGAASAISSGVHITTPTDPRVTVTGTILAHTFATDCYAPSTVVPTNANTNIQPYRIGVLTDAPTVEFQFRGFGSAYRVWVDGRPITLTTSALPSDGLYYRLTIAFTGRAARRVEVEIDTGGWMEIVVGPTDLLMAAMPRKGLRGLFLGDSYVEGTGAANRFVSFAQTFGQLAGWAETILSGSGGTGYLVPTTPGASGPGRVKFRDRFTSDVVSLTPDIVVFAGGRNDTYNSPPAAIGAEALLLFQTAAAALPRTLFYVCSIFPASAAEVADVNGVAVSNAIKASAVAVGFPFLDVMGANAFITGNGKAGATTGAGDADNLVTADGYHPTQLGHDVLARMLWHRYAAVLTP